MTLLTIGAIARLAGTSRQAMYSAAKTKSFPAPRVELESTTGTVRGWDKEEILEWLKEPVKRRLASLHDSYRLSGGTWPPEAVAQHKAEVERLKAIRDA